MAEPDFERQLIGLFADAPHLPDSDAFAASVEARLNQGWRLRRILIGGLGIVGGVVAAGQVAASSLQLQAENLHLPSLTDLNHQLNASFAGPAAQAGLSAETLLMSGALAIVALALGLTRMVKAI